MIITILAIALPFIIGIVLTWSLCRMAALAQPLNHPQHFGADGGGVDFKGGVFTHDGVDTV